MAELQRKCSPVPLAFDTFVPKGGQNTNGGKAPIILTHGLLLNRSAYRLLGKEMSDRTGRTVYNVDLRSHGESPYPEETGALEMAEDISAFIKGKQLKKVVFVCHSFSSRVATIVAITQPTIDVEKMILIDFAPYWSDLTWAKIHHKTNDSYETFFDSLSHETSLETAEKFIVKNVFGPKMVPIMKKTNFRFLVKKGNKIEVFADRETIHEAAMKGKFGFHARHMYHGQVMFVKEPTSVFWDNDTVALHEKYFPNSESVIIPDAGHMLPLEKPEEFLAEVERFLKSDS